jgi:pantoate kinase
MFTIKTGLGEKKVLEAIESANHYGMASMCMLGNSVFAIGNTNKLFETLSSFGKTYICSVSDSGVFLLDK